MSDQNQGSNPLFETHDGLSGAMIADGVFTRDGSDLTITGPNGQSITIDGYFAGLDQATLLSTDGARLTPDMVDSFLSHSNLYAQSTQTMNDIPPIAEATDVFGEVTVTRADGTKVSLESGMPIFQGDVIETTAEGAISITFADQTTFALSEDARLSIDEYVYNTAENGGSSLFSMLKGSFVYTSGLIGKDDPGNVNIETPAGSIGIRGTVVMGKITPTGDGSEITIIDGAIIVSNAAGTVELNDSFETAHFESYQQPPENIGQLTSIQIGETYGSLSQVASGTFQQMGIPVVPSNGDSDGSEADAASEGDDVPADAKPLPADAQQQVLGEGPNGPLPGQQALPGEVAEGEGPLPGETPPPLTPEQQEALDKLIAEEGLTEAEAMEALKQDFMEQQPLLEGQQPLPEGEKPLNESSEPLAEGDKPLIEGSEPLAEGDKPLAEGGETAPDGGLFLADGGDGQVIFNDGSDTFGSDTTDAFGKPIGPAPDGDGGFDGRTTGDTGDTGDTGFIGPISDTSPVAPPPFEITGLQNLYGGTALREFVEPGLQVARITTNADNVQFYIQGFFDPNDGTVEETELAASNQAPVSAQALTVNPFEINNEGIITTNNPMAFVHEFNSQIGMNIRIFNPQTGEELFTQFIADVDDMLNGGVRIIGNATTNLINGSASGDVIYGMDGDDMISGEGGQDVLLGGLGDDQLEVTDGTFELVSGDEGNDSIYINAEFSDPINIDFSAISTKIKDIEKFELNSANGEEITITLDVASVINMTDEDNVLTIDPWDSDDQFYTTINLEGFTDEGRVGVTDYNLYSANGGTVQVLVDQFEGEIFDSGNVNLI